MNTVIPDTAVESAESLIAGENANLKTFSFARGRPSDLGEIVEQSSVSLQGLADLMRQAQAQPFQLPIDEYEQLHAAKSAGDKAAKQRLESVKKTPWFVGARFKSETRNKGELVECTAFVGDADQPGTAREKLIADLDALGVSYLVVTSTSHGCGGQERYRVVLPLAAPVPANSFLPIWESINAHLGGILDPNAKDPTRLNYLPRIPTGAAGHEVILRDDRPWLDSSTLSTIESSATNATPAVISADDQVLTAISDEDWKRLNVALDFLRDKVASNSDWSEAGYGLLSLQYTRPVRELWYGFSRGAVGYEPGAEVEWWDTHCRQQPRSDWRHVLKMANERGMPRVASPDQFPPVPEDLTALATPVSAEPDLQRSRSGTPLSNVNNAITMLTFQKRLKISHDSFSGKVFLQWKDSPKPRVLTDEDDTRVQRELQAYGLVATTKTAASDAVRFVARLNTFDSVADYLNGLKWDGVRRLSKMMELGFGTPADRYHTRAGRNMLMSMAARGLNPGCQVDEAIVLEGDQGLRKTSAFRIIGGEFFKELTAHPNSKDFEQQLQGVWLGEFAELNALRRPEDINRLKQFITCRDDHLRLPYDRNVSDLPRRTVLCGSTNEEAWLHDPTGGRRFIPVKVRSIDLDWLSANRDQLFAEAVTLYKAGRKWWIYPKAATLAEQEARAVDDPWTASIRKYVCGRPEVDVTDILNLVLQIPAERQTKAHSTRVGITLKRLGCVAQSRRRVDGMRRRLWVVPAELAEKPVIVAGPVQSAPIESHFDLVGEVA